VTIVKNPKQPMTSEPVLELQEDLAIRGNEDIEEQMFQNIHSLDVDNRGNMYILDEQAANIKVFDKKGNYQKTVGKSGQGPGEFGLPISVVISHQNQIVVNDMGQRKIVFLDMDGNYLKQVSIADKFLFFGPAVTKDGDMIAMHTIPGEKVVTELKKFNSDLEPILTITSVPMEKPPVVDIFVARHLTSLRWNVSETDEIIWGDIKNPHYILSFHDLGGKLFKKIIRDYDPMAITAADREKLMDQIFGENPMRDQWDVRFPENYPPFMGFSFDDEGRIFVRRYEKEKNPEGNLIDVFDSQGRYLTQVRLKMNPLIWKNTFMYSIEENTEGFKAVKRYKVNWTL
jgi:hypothetical protein